MKSILLILLCGFSLVATAFAAEAEPKETDKTMPALGGKWSFEPATNPNPALPRVLLIGDSICIGYKAMVIKSLAEKANVDVWPHPMFQSEKLNQALVKNLKHGPYDVVHVNLGLHGVAEGRIKPGTYEPLTRQFIQIIRDTMPKVKIIWANTTQFTIKGKSTELDPVKNPTVLEHNRMAAKLMAEMNIPVNDFYGLLINKLELGRGDTVHWTPPAYQILADKAVASILQALGQEVAASPEAKPRVVCFGDSITKRGYPAELANMLGVTVANAGIAGHTSRQGLARMQKDVLDLKPELVVILFGTNDCRMAHEQVYVPPQRYEENLIAMVENYERLGIKTVLCTLPPISAEVYFKRTPREKYDEAGGLEKVIETYRDAALRVAEVKRIPVVDLNRLLAPHPEWMHPDGVHPTTPEGNRLIAQFVAEEVRPLLSTGSSAPVAPANAAPLPASPTTFAPPPAAGGSVHVVVYGGTSAGVIASVQVARLGKSVVLIEPGKHLGGMTTGGLGNTDVGKAESIGGTTREFYRRVLQWYQVPEHWQFYKKAPSPQELAEADKGKRITDDAMFVFEPHVAETLLNQMLAEAKVPVVFGERLDLINGVEKSGARIVSIRMESGRVFTGKTFLDCSYDGDLMARSGVPYVVGREANAQYGETYNGVQISEEKRKGERPLDPYVTPGLPGSGLIAGLQADVVGKVGDADRRVQAYNYRLCLTAQPENRVPFDKPAGYDEKEFELLFRWLEAGNTKGLPVGLSPIPNAKTDSNKAGWVSTDYIGQCDDYPDADYARREQITQAHIRYTKGLLWTLANHPRVPESVRRRAANLGYAKDEFADTGHFPHQLYVREGRRMLGEFVMTEHEALGARKVPDPVALGSYGMDAHPTQLWVDKEGFLRADTPIWKGVAANGYGISYRSLTPKAADCSNLLVPVCLSASHSVYGSLRMEPVYMMLGQAAATAAVLAVEDNLAVQNVPYTKLREQLLKAGQLLESGSKSAAAMIEKDICVYGGTAGGVTAAVQAARLGKSVVLLEPGKHIGGMTAGGLGATDIGNKGVIGGISREFYQRVAKHYASDAAWKWETAADYFTLRSSRTKQAEISGPDATMWTFEPHVAEQILRQLLAEAKVPVRFQQRLAAVKKSAARITEVTVENGDIFRAKMFIDATYEGDLMAKSGVSYIVGREANALFGETLNGIRGETPKNQITGGISPYVTPGDPTSGLIPLIQSGDGGKPGDGDHRVQAYNFRLCFTDIAANRLPLTPPAHYDPARYELAARRAEAIVASGAKPLLKNFCTPVWMPNRKTDINNGQGISTDFIGENYAYPDGDYATRAKIWQAHEDYVRGFWYFMATSLRVPESLRAEFKSFGPAKDEFPDTGGWPYQLYVREARRMISDYVMTEHNCRSKVVAEDPVGMAAYGMDSHNCQRIVQNGMARNEGDVQEHELSPYPVSYRSIVPKASECENLLVPVCLSATHIAYGSIRMEPVFMVLGQSAATAAALASDEGIPVQQLRYEDLRARLLAAGQVLAVPANLAPPKAGEEFRR